MIIKEKVAQAIGILKEFNIDCWVTFVRESSIIGDPTLDFLIDSDVTWHSAFIITPKGDTWAIVGKYDTQAIADLGVYGTVIPHVTGLSEPFHKVLKQINPSKIAVNYSKDSEISDGLTHGMYLTLVDLLSAIGMQDRLISAEPVISALRQRKTATELAHINDAIRATLEIYDEAFKFIKPGKTEAEVAAYIRSRIDARKLGYAWDPSTCPSVFSGPDTAEAHYAPTERRVQEGHILNMDFGVKSNEYCSDLQRTVYILRKGETKAPPEVQKGFDTIVKSIEESRKAMKPGVLGKDIDGIIPQGPGRQWIPGVSPRLGSPGRTVCPRWNRPVGSGLGEVRNEAIPASGKGHGLHTGAPPDCSGPGHCHGGRDGRRHRSWR